jgi:rubrerythrin
MQAGTTMQNKTSFPVDNRTYNVCQALTSTLEAIEAYAKYQSDDTSGLFEELARDEQAHAERLLEELRSCLSQR